MIVITKHGGKIYPHDEAGLAALQAEYPDVYAKVVKNKPEKVEVKKVKTKKNK